MARGRKGGSSSIHARERAQERYGLVLSHEDVLGIIILLEKVLNKTATVHELPQVRILADWRQRFPPTVRAAIHYEGIWLPVVYSTDLKIIKSVLPVGELPQDLRP